MKFRMMMIFGLVALLLLPYRSEGLPDCAGPVITGEECTTVTEVIEDCNQDFFQGAPACGYYVTALNLTETPGILQVTLFQTNRECESFCDQYDDDAFLESIGCNDFVDIPPNEVVNNTKFLLVDVRKASKNVLKYSSDEFDISSAPSNLKDRHILDQRLYTYKYTYGEEDGGKVEITFEDGSTVKKQLRNLTNFQEGMFTETNNPNGLPRFPYNPISFYSISRGETTFYFIYATDIKEDDTYTLLFAACPEASEKRCVFSNYPDLNLPAGKPFGEWRKYSNYGLVMQNEIAIDFKNELYFVQTLPDKPPNYGTDLRYEEYYAPRVYVDTTFSMVAFPIEPSSSGRGSYCDTVNFLFNNSDLIRYDPALRSEFSKKSETIDERIFQSYSMTKNELAGGQEDEKGVLLIGNVGPWTVPETEFYYEFYIDPVVVGYAFDDDPLPLGFRPPISENQVKTLAPSDTYDNVEGIQGIMFEVVAKQNIYLVDMTLPIIDTISDEVEVYLYTKGGSYENMLRRPRAWKVLEIPNKEYNTKDTPCQLDRSGSTDSFMLSATNNLFAFAPLKVDKGESISFFFVTKNPEKDGMFKKVSGGTMENDDLIVKAGLGSEGINMDGTSPTRAFRGNYVSDVLFTGTINYGYNSNGCLDSDCVEQKGDGEVVETSSAYSSFLYGWKASILIGTIFALYLS